MDFFHLTATSGLTRGGVHPEILALFFLVGIAMGYLLSPTLDFSHECKEGSLIFFHLTATSGLTRGGVHPKIWSLFFLGGHFHELFFEPHNGFLPRV